MGLPRSENLLILERGAKIPAGGKKEERQREVLQLQWYKNTTTILIAQFKSLCLLQSRKEKKKKKDRMDSAERYFIVTEL